MNEFDYDLVTIGAGSGGVRASRMAASYGAKSAVIEDFRVGGTCVIRGCVPKKLLVYASRFGEDFEDCEGFGWRVPHKEFSWPKLIANKDREIARLEGLYTKNLDKAGVRVIAGRATLRSPHEVEIASTGEILRARTILIATGARPHMPEDIQGLGLAITSNEAFHLPEQPKSILIVGGGYIAVEFAGIFHGLGTHVTLAHHSANILRGFDHEIRERMRHELQKRGIDVRCNTRVLSIEERAGAKFATLSDGSHLNVSQVMFATGRRPNTQGLGLESAHVRLTPSGGVAVDNYSRSSLPHIYAVGDVTDRINLTPVAIREGAAFAETVFNNNPVAVDHKDIPTAVFGTPEIGAVGMTEEDVRAAHSQIDIYKAGFRPLKATLSGRDTLVFMKVIVDGRTDRVLGCHILGEAASEIIQAIAIAVKMKATKADFDATMAVHPSLSEELVLLKTKG